MQWRHGVHWYSIMVPLWPHVKRTRGQCNDQIQTPFFTKCCFLRECLHEAISIIPYTDHHQVTTLCNTLINCRHSTMSHSTFTCVPPAKKNSRSHHYNICVKGRGENNVHFTVQTTALWPWNNETFIMTLKYKTYRPLNLFQLSIYKKFMNYFSTSFNVNRFFKK